MENSKITKTDKRHKWDWSNIESLIALYESGKTLQEVGRIYNISHERVRQIFKSIGYKTRRYTSTEQSRIKLAKSARARRVVLPKKELERLYWQERLTIKTIAKILNVTLGIVYQNFIRHGIPTRSRHEIGLMQPNKNPGLTKEKLYRLYIVEDKSQAEIGKLFDYAPITIAKLAAQYGFRKIKGETYQKRYGRFGKQLQGND